MMRCDWRLHNLATVPALDPIAGRRLVALHEQLLFEDNLGHTVEHITLAHVRHLIYSEIAERTQPSAGGETSGRQAP